MQKRSLVALLLLSVFGFGLLAAPHPCEASHGKEEAVAPSCHGPAHPANGPEARAGALPTDEERNGCDTFCQHACHMTAVAAAAPVPFAIAPVSQMVAAAHVSRALLFAQPIDHIPLG